MLHPPSFLPHPHGVMGQAEKEAFRSQMRDVEMELRSRIEEELGRVKAELGLARSKLDTERVELLQRVAKAEAVGQTRQVEVYVAVGKYRGKKHAIYYWLVRYEFSHGHKGNVHKENKQTHRLIVALLLVIVEGSRHGHYPQDVCTQCERSDVFTTYT